MVKKVNAQVTLEENCEYQSSTVNRIIEIEPQTVDIDITIINTNINHHYDINHDNIEDNDIYYYDDILEVRAFVHQKSENNTKIIQTGRVEFYFQPKDSANRKLINDDVNSCTLTQDGLASALYRPNKDGQFIAKYIDDKEWYATTEKQINVTLKPIPVEIEFTKKPPYLTDLKDSVELEVEVSKRYPNPTDGPLNYGVVTFLHYVEHFDVENPHKRVERVIGNPVLVENGIAKIKYIPVQEYSDMEEIELVEGTEYIRAVYNYDNDIYYDAENNTYNYEAINYELEPKTNKWQYYSSANVYTNIRIYKPNSVLIGIENKSTDTDGMYHFTANTDITLTATLYTDDEELILDDDDPKSLTFHIIGTYPTLRAPYLVNSGENSDDYFIYNKYELDTDFDTYQNGCFKKTIKLPRIGDYTICASTNGQIINGEVKLYPSNQTLDSDDIITITDDNGEEHLKYDTDEVRTDTYIDRLDISNMLYIKSESPDILYTATISCDNDTTLIRANIKNTIHGDISNLATTYKKNYLNNQKCYFYSPTNNMSYEGILTYNTDNDTLTASVTDDIIFETVGDYVMYLYVPPGYYKNGTYVTFIGYIPSQPIIIKARDTPDISLDYQYVNRIMYGIVDYNVYTPNMAVDYTTEANIILLKNNTTLQTDNYVFTRTNNQFSGRFDNLTAGDYIISIRLKDGTVHKNINFIIEKDRVRQEIESTSTVIRANPMSTINLFLYSENNNMNLFDLNQMNIYLQSTDDNYSVNNATRISPQNITIQERNQEYIKLTVAPRIYTDGEWYIGATYIGDSNFEHIECEPSIFSTMKITPKITIDNISIDSIQLKLDNNINNVCVIGEIVYMQGNRPLTQYGTDVFITNEQGVCSITNIPNECNNIQFRIDPEDTQLKTFFLRQPAQIMAALQASYTHCFTAETASISISKIKQQFEQTQRTSLFPLYDSTTQQIVRNIL